jgi:hypothetical protein
MHVRAPLLQFAHQLGGLVRGNPAAHSHRHPGCSAVLRRTSHGSLHSRYYKTISAAASLTAPATPKPQSPLKQPGAGEISSTLHLPLQRPRPYYRRGFSGSNLQRFAGVQLSPQIGVSNKKRLVQGVFRRAILSRF